MLFLSGIAGKVSGLTFISGKVCAQSGAPIEHAVATLDDTAFTTETYYDGNFFFTNIPIRLYHLRIVAPGYRDYNVDVDMTKNSTYDLNTIKLQRRNTVPGHVRAFADRFWYDQPVVSIGINQGWRSMGEISFGLCDYYYHPDKFLPLQTLETISIGSEFDFSRDKPLIGPKLSWTYTSYVGAGADLTYFTDFDRGTLYFNPHLGCSFGTVFNLWLGYNIPLMRNYMKPRVNRFTLSLILHICNVNGDTDKQYIRRGKWDKR